MFGKKRVPKNPFDREELKLINYIDSIDCNSPEYERAQKLLKENAVVRESSRESRRRLSKESRGSIWLKILGITGTIGGIFAVAKFEKDGMTYTGQKRNLMDSLVRTAANFIGAKGG